MAHPIRNSPSSSPRPRPHRLINQRLKSSPSQPPPPAPNPSNLFNSKLPLAWMSQKGALAGWSEAPRLVSATNKLNRGATEQALGPLRGAISSLSRDEPLRAPSEMTDYNLSQIDRKLAAARKSSRLFKSSLSEAEQLGPRLKRALACLYTNQRRMAASLSPGS